MNRAGQIAVITGAGSGFGLEFARLAAARGMKLVLADIQGDALEAARAAFAAQGVPVLARRVDVAKAEQIEALAQATVEAFGVPHLLFNNAGVATGGLIWEHSTRDWEWTLGVNLWGVIHGVRVFTPLMLQAAAADPSYRGHIVNTASMAGLINAPATGAYNVSKQAVVSLSETLYHDLSLLTEQVHCSVLCPYFVPTGIHQSERNRPSELGNAAPLTRSQLIAQANADKAVTSGKLTAAQIAEMTFAAIDTQQFYILSHPQALGAARTRLEDIVALRNPSDPFQERPDLRERLVAALRA